MQGGLSESQIDKAKSAEVIMGLQVWWLKDSRDDAARDCYVYVIYFAAEGAITKALHSFFSAMKAGIYNASGATPYLECVFLDDHYHDKVFTWIAINGEDCANAKLLPALVITATPPWYFDHVPPGDEDILPALRNFILIPIHSFCSTPADIDPGAIGIIGHILSAVGHGRPLAFFRVARRLPVTVDCATVEEVVLDRTKENCKIDIREVLGLPTIIGNARRFPANDASSQENPKDGMAIVNKTGARSEQVVPDDQPDIDECRKAKEAVESMLASRSIPNPLVGESEAMLRMYPKILERRLTN